MKQVLLVEDDHWLAESYQSILEKAGFAVLVVTNGYEAMAVVDEKPVDILLVDFMLEGHTAVGLLHELQTYDDTRRIPVVICSALNDRLLEVDRLHSYGVVAVLNKATLTPEQLVLTLREIGP